MSPRSPVFGSMVALESSSSKACRSSALAMRSSASVNTRMMPSLWAEEALSGSATKLITVSVHLRISIRLCERRVMSEMEAVGSNRKGCLNVYGVTLSRKWLWTDRTSVCQMQFCYLAPMAISPLGRIQQHHTDWAGRRMVWEHSPCLHILKVLSSPVLTKSIERSISLRLGWSRYHLTAGKQMDDAGFINDKAPAIGYAHISSLPFHSFIGV